MRVRARNDPGQYDDLAGEWWRPDGVFAMLHWIARARARLIPPATGPGAVLVDLGCGAGLLAPHAAASGYRHVGVDITASALEQAAAHGVTAVRGDVTRVPLADGCADVVCAGEIFEHVTDVRAAIGEACRLVRPGGVLIADTINATAVARLIAVTIGERIPGVAPRGIHDPSLFVPVKLLRETCAAHGIPVRTRGLRPSVPQLARWLVTHRGEVAMKPGLSAAVLYQATGVRPSGPSESEERG